MWYVSRNSVLLVNWLTVRFILFFLQLEDQEAVDIITPYLKQHEVEKACSRLRNVAYARGSTDNVTVVVIQLLDQEQITALKKSGKSGWCSVSWARWIFYLFKCAFVYNNLKL